MNSDKLDIDFLIQKNKKSYSIDSQTILDNSAFRVNKIDEQDDATELVDLSLLTSNTTTHIETETDRQIDHGLGSDLDLLVKSENSQELPQLDFDITDDAVNLVKEFDCDSDVEEEQVISVVLENSKNEPEILFDAPVDSSSLNNDNPSQKFSESNFLTEAFEESSNLPAEPEDEDFEKEQNDFDDVQESDNTPDFQFGDSGIDKVNLQEESDDLLALIESFDESINLPDEQKAAEEDDGFISENDSLILESEILKPRNGISETAIENEQMTGEDEAESLIQEEDDEPLILSNKAEFKAENGESEPFESEHQTTATSQKTFHEGPAKQNLFTASMSLTSLFENTKLLGLDIGATSLKYIILRKTARGIKLIDCGMRSVPKAPDGASDEEKSELIKDILLKNFKLNAQKNTLIISAISGLEVLYQNVQVPKMARKELSKSVPWACRKDFPFPIESTIFEFQVIDNKIKNTENKLDVFVQAAQKDLVSRHLEFLSEAKIVPAKVSTIPVALWKMFGALVKKNAEKCHAIIDIGGSSSHIVFINHGQLQFAREISTAGDDITDALTGSIFIEGEEITITREKAESIKRKYGLVNEFSDDDREGAIPLKEISVLMGPVLEKFVKEIQRTVDYFKEKFHVDTLEKIFLTGGGAFLNNLTSYLENELSSEVEILNPFQTFSTKNVVNQPDLLNNGSRFAVAFGLALDKKKELNFLPNELKGAQTFQYTKKIFRYSIVIIILTMLLLSQNTRLQIKNINNELKNIKTSYSVAEPKRAKFVSLQNILVGLTVKKELYQKEISKYSNYTNHLKVISHLILSNIALTSFKVDTRLDKEKQLNQELVILEGVAFQNNSMEGVNLAKFLLSLENSNYFNYISLKSQKIREDGNLEFTIVCVN